MKSEANDADAAIHGREHQAPCSALILQNQGYHITPNNGESNGKEIGKLNGNWDSGIV